MNLNLIKAYTKRILQTDVSGHDFYHCQRVAVSAQKLWQQDFSTATYNDEIDAASYLHDTIDEKIVTDPQKALSQIRTLLTTVGFNASQQKDIISTITQMSFSKNITKQQQLPLFGQYVQDADRLDALGAIGIARAFAYGGSHQQPIYDPHLQPEKLSNHFQYRHHQTTTINHFYEKLLHLQNLMNTKAGKKSAQQRSQYMQQFLTEFQQEWDGQK